MSEPAVPYIAPWKTGFRRYSVQTFQAVAATGGGPVTPTFLGSFTQAQWPPSAGAVSQGQLAALADTYGGVTFAWLLEYRPDLDGTYPWRAYNGLALGYADLLKPNASANSTFWNFPSAAWTESGNMTLGGTAGEVALQVPVAGVYTCRCFIAGSSTDAATTVSVGLSTSSSVQPSAGNYGSGLDNAGYNVYKDGISLTQTKGALLYVWFNANTTTPSIRLVGAGLYPNKIANS